MQKSQITFAFGLAGTWLAFGVVYTGMSLIAPLIDALHEHMDVRLVTNYEVVKTMVGMNLHVLIAIAATALLFWSEIKSIDQERKQVIGAMVLFFNLSWVSYFSVTLVLSLGTIAARLT